MKRWPLLLFLLLFAGAFVFADCGGGGSGGGTNTSTSTTNTTTPTSTTTTTTTTLSNINEATNADMEGSWNWEAGTFTGIMTFQSGRLVQFTNSRCSNQILSASMFLNQDPSYCIKFTNHAWCSSPNGEMKFALRWTDTSKRTASGILDIHPDAVYNYPDFTRYQASMRKR